MIKDEELTKATAMSYWEENGRVLKESGAVIPAYLKDAYPDRFNGVPLPARGISQALEIAWHSYTHSGFPMYGSEWELFVAGWDAALKIATGDKHE